MGTLGFVVALFVGGAIPLGALWMVARRAMRQLDAAEAYREIALQQGLQVDTRGASVRGHLGNRRLWVGEVLEGFGPDRRIEVRGLMSFDRPLGLGLRVVPRGAWARWTGRTPRSAVDEPAFDQRFEFVADDRNVAGGLLRGAPAHHLVQLAAAGAVVRVDDDEIGLWLPESPATALELQGWIDRLSRAVDAILAARARISAPAEVGARTRGWSSLAESCGLRHEAAWPAISGEREGRCIEVVARREGDRYAAAVTVCFRPHAEIGLLLLPQHEPDGFWSVGQDIQVGDPAFDPRFVVKGWDPPAVVARLGPDARRLLCGLADRGRVVADDRALVIRGVPLGASEVASVLRDAQDAAEAMGW